MKPIYPIIAMEKFNPAQIPHLSEAASHLVTAKRKTFQAFPLITPKGSIALYWPGFHASRIENSQNNSFRRDEMAIRIDDYTWINFL